jgi:hypothetical protein
MTTKHTAAYDREQEELNGYEYRNQQEAERITRHTAPTARPWTFVNNRITDSAGRRITIVAGDARPTSEDRANADYIVRCVNSHEKLVAAGKTALTAFRYLRDKDTQAWDLAVTPEICNAWDDLRAALAEAEKGKG